MSVDGSFVLAFLLGIGLTLLLCAVGYFAVWSWRRRAAASAVCPKVREGAELARPDLEAGQGAPGKRDEVPELTPRSFRETLRFLLDSEVAKRVHEPEFLEQLGQLGDKVARSGAVDAAAAGPAAAGEAAELRGKASAIGLRAAASGCKEGGLQQISTFETRTPNSSDQSGGSSAPAEPPAEPPTEELPGVVCCDPPLPLTPPWVPEGDDPPAPQQPAPLSEAGLRHRIAAARQCDAMAPPLEFGPTHRQCMLPEPPERSFVSIDDQETADRSSLATVRQSLLKRDAQCTELQRQLRQARQHLWQQTAESRASSSRLYEYLADPHRAPQAQADAIERLRQEVKQLSSGLAESRAQEKYWSSIARRQRMFFLQSEHTGGDAATLVRRHPAGEVFLAPPPVTSPYEEEDRQDFGPGWNVGKSHCDPYSVDSWPFEPNVLAQRASREPNLHQCEEGEDEGAEEDDEDDIVEDDEDEEDPRRHWSEDRDDDSPVPQVEDEGDDEGRVLRAAMGRGEVRAPTDMPTHDAGLDSARSA